MGKIPDNVKIAVSIVSTIVTISLIVYFSIRNRNGSLYCKPKLALGECTVGCHCKNKKKGDYCNTIYNKCIPKSKCNLLSESYFDKTCKSYIP